MKKIIILICLIPLLGAASFHLKKQGLLIDRHKQIYLLLGQSNMAGRGEVTPEYKAIQNSRVIMLTKDNQWIIAQHPIHFDKPQVAGVGPGLSFGITIAEAYPKDTIALVPCSVGGTSIEKWEPGAYDKATGTHPYDDALIRIHEAMKKGEISGAIWLQGESDSNLQTMASQDYVAKLATLVNNIRREVNDPYLPFVIGELGRYRDNYLEFNKHLAKAPSRIPHISLVTSEYLVHKGDTTHFDSPSATIYGQRFAKAMLKIKN